MLVVGLVGYWGNGESFSSHGFFRSWVYLLGWGVVGLIKEREMNDGGEM